MRLKVAFIVSVLLLLVSGGSVFSSDPIVDFEILTLGVGSRPFGMGGTHTAIADDVNAVYWNPAGLGMLDRKELTGMYSQFFNYEYLAYVHPVEDIGTFGFSGYYYQYQEDLWDVAVMMSYGREINNTTSLGLTGKFLRKELRGKYAEQAIDRFGIISESTSTSTLPSFGVDVGILYKVSDEIHLAGVIQNLSAAVVISSTTVAEKPWKELPLMYKLGAAIKLFDGILTVGFDLNLPAGDEERFITIGGEYWVLDWIALRTGYNTRAGQDSGLHFGVGMGNKNIHLDWILVPFEGMKEKINRISLTLRFGRDYRYTLIESSIERHFKRGKRFYYRGEFIRAYNEFKSILELVPRHKDVSDYLARTKVRLDEYDTSKEIAGYFERGEKYFNKGDLVKSRFEFDSLLIINPEHIGTNRYLERIQKRAEELIDNQMKKAVKYYDRGDYRIAREHINKVLSFNPRHKKANKYSGLIEDKLNKVEKAKEEQKEQREGKWKAISDFYKGLALFNLGQWAESIKIFKDVLKYDPGHEGSMEYLGKAKIKAANLHYNKGFAYFKKGKYKSAIREFNYSLKYVPDNSRIKDKIKESRANIKKENKEKAEKYYTQGLGSYTQGDIEGAIKIWKLAIKLDPESETIENALKRAIEEVKIDKDIE